MQYSVVATCQTSVTHCSASNPDIWLQNVILYVSVVNNRKNLNQPTLLGVRENLQDVQKRFEPFSALDPLARSSERGFSKKGRKLTRNPAELQQREGFFERDFPRRISNGWCIYQQSRQKRWWRNRPAPLPSPSPSTLHKKTAMRCSGCNACFTTPASSAVRLNTWASSHVSSPA